MEAASSSSSAQAPAAGLQPPAPSDAPLKSPRFTAANRHLAQWANEFSTLALQGKLSHADAIQQSAVQPAMRVVEAALTRLEELGALMDSLRSSLAVTTVANVGEMARLEARAAQLETLFAQIDQLERFVLAVESSVARMEDSARSAKEQYGTGLFAVKKAVNKFFNSFMEKATQKKRPSTESFEWKPIDFLVDSRDFLRIPPPLAVPAPDDAVAEEAELVRPPPDVSSRSK